MSKSQKWQNGDRAFIASVLNDLENQNLIFSKQTNHGFDSYFIEIDAN